MKHYNVSLLTSLLFCALSVAACARLGGRDMTASRLVTKADAERVLGLPIPLETDTTSGIESTCTYGDAADTSRPSLQVTIVVAESAEQVKDADESAKRFEAKTGTVEVVEGIGDEAWLVRREGEQALHVRKNNIAFLLKTTKGGGKEPAYDELKRIAKRVADQL